MRLQEDMCGAIEDIFLLHRLCTKQRRRSPALPAATPAGSFMMGICSGWDFKRISAIFIEAEIAGVY